MKKIILIIGLAAFSSTLFAQKSVKRFYNKYKNTENVTNVKVQGWMIKSVLTFVEDFEGDDIVKKVTKLRVLTMENGNLVSKKDLRNLIQGVKSESFEDLMTVRDGTTNVRFMIRDSDEKIKDLLVIVSESDEFILISIECDLKWKDLKNIDFDKINGGEYFEILPPTLPNVPRA